MTFVNGWTNSGTYVMPPNTLSIGSTPVSDETMPPMLNDGLVATAQRVEQLGAALQSLEERLFSALAPLDKTPKEFPPEDQRVAPVVNSVHQLWLELGHLTDSVVEMTARLRL